MKKQKIRLESGTENDNASEDSTAEKELRRNLKEKNKKLAEAESRARILGDKLAEIEAKQVENGVTVDEKFRKVDDKLTSKSKEIKKVQQQLKQAETRANKLLDDVNDKNKKISELENGMTRLRLMKNHAEEIGAKTKKTENKVKGDTKATDAKTKEKVEEKPKEAKKKEKDDVKPKDVKKSKCRYENTGSCRRRSQCDEYHPRTTCQSFSKLGSCPLESSCEHRHPYGICYDWNKFGSCYEGDNCRHRHPYDLVVGRSTSPNHFLGKSSPSRGLGGVGDRGQGSQKHRGQHHDRRGNRH